MKMSYSFHDYGHQFRYQGSRQSQFITDIMKGEYGDVWGETLTEWGSGEDTFGIKAKIVSEMRDNDNMKQEIIEKAVEFGVFFEEVYKNDKERNSRQLRSLTYQLKKTFDAIMRLLEVGEDTLKAWNSLKQYSLNGRWDTNKAIKEGGDMQRAIVKKIAVDFVDSQYYEKKLAAWVATEGKKKMKHVKQRIVNELKMDMTTSIDVIAHTIKQTDMQTDDIYTDMYVDNSDFDHIFLYIFNCIATVLGSGATNTLSAWNKLKENENKTIHGMYCFNVKAAIKSIVPSEPAIVFSDPMDIDEPANNLKALLQLLQSYISC